MNPGDSPQDEPVQPFDSEFRLSPVNIETDTNPSIDDARDPQIPPQRYRFPTPIAQTYALNGDRNDRDNNRMLQISAAGQVERLQNFLDSGTWNIAGLNTNDHSYDHSQDSFYLNKGNLIQHVHELHSEFLNNEATFYCFNEDEAWVRSSLSEWTVRLNSIINRFGDEELIEFPIHQITRSGQYWYLRGTAQRCHELWDFFRRILLPGISHLVIEKVSQNEYHILVESSPGVAIELAPINHYPGNWLWYGAPGTGKSYSLQAKIEQIRGNGVWNEVHSTKISFSPSTTYADFVGEFKPVVIYDRDGAPTNYVNHGGLGIERFGTPIIEYRFVPGHFLTSLGQALIDGNSAFILLIDEVNRGDIYEIFGEVFQLMERSGGDPHPNRGSKFLKLNPEEIAYLSNVMGDTESIHFANGEVRLPENFFIWATMNPNDASVQQIDSAFIRRWTPHYYGIDAGEVQDAHIDRLNCEWEILRASINNTLTENHYDEAQLLGRWFVNRADCNDWNVFSSKVIFHLANFVVKDQLSILFDPELQTVQQVMQRCEQNVGFSPFNAEIRSEYQLPLEDE